MAKQAVSKHADCIQSTLPPADLLFPIIPAGTKTNASQLPQSMGMEGAQRLCFLAGKFARRPRSLGRGPQPGRFISRPILKAGLSASMKCESVVPRRKFLTVAPTRGESVSQGRLKPHLGQDKTEASLGTGQDPKAHLTSVNEVCTEARQ